jgi:hypothetical protein
MSPTQTTTLRSNAPSGTSDESTWTRLARARHELRFFPFAKALLYFEGVAVDRVYPGDALNSGMIVIDVLARGELSNYCEFLFEPARAFHDRRNT